MGKGCKIRNEARNLGEGEAVLTEKDMEAREVAVFGKGKTTITNYNKAEEKPELKVKNGSKDSKKSKV